MLTLYWAVSGKTWGGLQLYDESNKLSRHEALRILTNGSAWFSNEEKQKGFIKKGMFADFALLSDDYFSIPEAEIKNLTSDLTVVNGKIVFAKGAFASLDPEIAEIIPDWAPSRFYGGYQSN